MSARVPVSSTTRAPGGTTSAYVLGTDDALLVDPADRTEELDRAVESRNVAHVAVTHHHPDHVGGVEAYADAYDLTVWGRLGREDAFESACGRPPDRVFGPGSTIPAAGGIGVRDTPGHAPEHVAFDPGGVLVTGDLVVAEGSVVVGAPEGDMRAYLSSLRQVHALDPRLLLPAHGPVIETPRAACGRLIEHRLDREERVRKAVLEGHRSPDAIVDAVYEKDVSDVYDLARATVVAHLEKLAVEKRVRWDGEQARPVDAKSG